MDINDTIDQVRKYLGNKSRIDEVMHHIIIQRRTIKVLYITVAVLTGIIVKLLFP